MKICALQRSVCLKCTNAIVALQSLLVRRHRNKNCKNHEISNENCEVIDDFTSHLRLDPPGMREKSLNHLMLLEKYDENYN